MDKIKEKADTSRLFTASLKPFWSIAKSEKFCKSMNGSANIWIITHDKDTNTEGKIIEAHTHIVIEYDTPRKLSTVANLLEVPQNFIELGKSKKALLRYLTHKDDLDKFQYADTEVISNYSQPYAELIFANNLSDRQIADLIKEGKGYDLFGLVPVNKLRTIQSFLQYDRAGHISRQMQQLLDILNAVDGRLQNIEGIAVGLMTAGTRTIQQFTEGINKIASEVRLARLKSQGK
jgi:hypothetical protein